MFGGYLCNFIDARSRDMFADGVIFKAAFQGQGDCFCHAGVSLAWWKTEIEIDRQHFPILFANKKVKVLKAEVFLQPKKGKTGITVPGSIKIIEKNTETDKLKASSSGEWVKLPHSEIMKINLTLNSEDFSPFGRWSFEVNDPESLEDKRLKENEIEDLLILMSYSLAP